MYFSPRNANYNIMRPTSFDSSVLRAHLLQHKIADLPALKSALGTDTDLTVFRKLKPLDPVTSYTHRGRFYTLAEIARFDQLGLWEHDSVWFSRHGTLLSSVESFVKASPDGYFARELAAVLHADVQEPLRHLVQQQRLHRSELDGQFLYTSAESSVRRQQALTRRNAARLAGIVHASDLRVSPDELQAAILLFHATLDEQQRRLFAGLESMRAGQGGDKLIAEFLHLDPHTVSRGRQQLLDRDILAGRSRRPGAGRPRQEKKRQK
jgi:hypothetical protein